MKRLGLDRVARSQLGKTEQEDGQIFWGRKNRERRNVCHSKSWLVSIDEDFHKSRQGPFFEVIDRCSGRFDSKLWGGNNNGTRNGMSGRYDLPFTPPFLA